MSEEQYVAQVGCPPVGGVQDADAVTRGSFMPTIEVNGIHSGYGGPGSKTVIPSVAVAKLSTRLVPGQAPSETFEAMRKHLEANCPRGMRLEISDAFRGAPGFRLPLNSPVFRLAADVLERMDETLSARFSLAETQRRKEAESSCVSAPLRLCEKKSEGVLFRWDGASIPIIATLRHISGAAPLLVGFGREEDKIHCPNESFSVEQFVQCMTWSSLMLSALGE